MKLQRCNIVSDEHLALMQQTEHQKIVSYVYGEISKSEGIYLHICDINFFLISTYIYIYMCVCVCVCVCVCMYLHARDLT